MDDSHREIASPLDPRVCVHQMDVLPVDADRVRLAAIASRAIPDPRNPMRRNGLRRPRRSHAPPHRMKAGTEAMLVAAAMMPTWNRFPPNAYAKSGIKVDVAPPEIPIGRYE